MAILQARLGSTRLPNKVLLPLLGKPMLQQIIERVQRAKRIDDVVLAVPKEPESHLLEAIAEKTKCIYGRFDHLPAEDLVSRYLGAAKAYNAEIVVRIPCDNPCVDPVYIDTAVENYLLSPQVFYTNTTGLHWEAALDGIGCEVFSMSRLKWMNIWSLGNLELREHPHKCFRKYRDYELPEATIRLDVNTQADYEFIQDIYDHFQRNDFTTAEIVAYLESKKVSV